MRHLLFCLIAVLSAPTFAADPTSPTGSTDKRQAVSMPAEARAELRNEMLDFQFALDRIIAALAAGRYDEAASIAEQAMGVGSMGRHRNAPAHARPGMHMPPEMHNIGRGLHVSASEFAKAAKTGDTAKSLTALTAVTGACVACHQVYRIQ